MMQAVAYWFPSCFGWRESRCLELVSVEVAMNPLFCSFAMTLVELYSYAFFFESVSRSRHPPLHMLGKKSSLCLAKLHRKREVGLTSASLAADRVSGQIESAPAETIVGHTSLCSEPCDGSWPAWPMAAKSLPEG